MKCSRPAQRSLLEPWLAWEGLPDVVRQHALDVLTALYLEVVDVPHSEPENDDSSSD
jgi:hypothetical protein